jgi:sugar O-acyltransferase (sialic acid O-acetyltransferase NeuD family)
MIMEKVILFGTGQVAALHYANLSHDSPYQVVAFTVDREYLPEEQLFGLPVVPFDEIQQVCPPADHRMLVSVSYRGVNSLRTEKYLRAKAMGYSCIRYVSSSARVSAGVEIGENTVIGHNTVLDPYVKIGNNVSIASGCTIGHHTEIQDHCFLAAGAVVSGSVTIEPACFLGAGAILRDRIHIARECVIGAGAVIMESTNPREVYLGSPARLLPITSDRLPLQ